MVLALNIATLLGMAGITATGIWLFRLLKPVASARAIALNMLYPTAQLVFIGFFQWCLALPQPTPGIAMQVPLPICCAVCIVGNMLMFPNLPIGERSRQFELEARQLRAATEASLRDLREQRANIERALRWRDGANDQIAALRRALADHDLPGAEYAANMIADAAGRRRANICDHPAANALLADECARMRERGIAVDCVANIPRDIGIDGAALCAVIGNLLDNAINACSPTPLHMPLHMSDSAETDNQTTETDPRMSDSGETDNRHTQITPRMTDSAESDNQTHDSVPHMTNSPEMDIQTANPRPRMTNSPETDIQTSETDLRVTDSGETDNQTHDSVPHMADSPEMDIQATNPLSQMTDSGETDTGAPWVRIRIGVGRGDDGSCGSNAVLTVRVSNMYDSATHASHTHARSAAHTGNSVPGFGDHGWGMRIVEQIARQQHGTFAYGVGEDAHYGPCWYAIATLACSADSAPAPHADLANSTNPAIQSTQANHTNPATLVNPTSPTNPTTPTTPTNTTNTTNPTSPTSPANPTKDRP